MRREHRDSRDIGSKLASLKKLLPSLLLSAPPPPPVTLRVHRPTSAFGKRICSIAKSSHLMSFMYKDTDSGNSEINYVQHFVLQTADLVALRLVFPLQVCSSLPTRLLRLHPWTVGLVITAVLIMSTSPLALSCVKPESCFTRSWNCRNPARPPAQSEVTECSSADSVRTLHLRFRSPFVVSCCCSFFFFSHMASVGMAPNHILHAISL